MKLVRAAGPALRAGSADLNPSTRNLDECPIPGPARTLNTAYMPFYLCFHCHAVRKEPDSAPFAWCDCGQVLDASAQLAEISELETRIRRRRFNRDGDRVTVAPGASLN